HLVASAIAFRLHGSCVVRTLYTEGSYQASPEPTWSGPASSRWRRPDSNRRPPACKAGALPLSYVPAAMIGATHPSTRRHLMDLPEPLVMADWLTNALNADPSSLVVADVRWYPDGSARRRFESGHIPAAVFVDVDRDLSAPV